MGNLCCKDSSDESTKTQPSDSTTPYQALEGTDPLTPASPPRHESEARSRPAESPARFRSPGTDILHEDHMTDSDSDRDYSVDGIEDDGKDVGIADARVDIDNVLLDGEDEEEEEEEDTDPRELFMSPQTPRMRLVTDAHGNESFEVEEEQEGLVEEGHVDTTALGSDCNTTEPSKAPLTRLTFDAHGKEVIVTD